MQLRPYQKAMVDDIYTAWSAGHRNVLGVLPTGGGKTAIASAILHRELRQKPVVAIAHRKELVGQISLALARFGVSHTVIGPSDLVRYCINYQQQELQTSFYNPTANCAVIAVRTLIARRKTHENWCHGVGTWWMDEGHHVLQGNEWGEAVQMFSNAKGLGVTATPCRADGKGLGRHANGVMDTMVLGPGMRDLIKLGYLCDYRIVCPTSDIHMTDDDIGSTGDYTGAKLKAAAKRSHIVGDVVKTYRRFALDMQTVVFATDIETATDMALRFQADNVRAEVVTGETDPAIRTNLIRRFRSGEIRVLVNVDLFGEGFDVPAIECVIMARPTASYGLYCQQFGRALRILEGKTHGLIVDTVGNVSRHGLPDSEREWSLDSKERRPRAKNADDDIPQKICVACSQPFQAFHTVCPYCGTEPVPAARSSIKEVDGDLHELSPEVLARLRGELRAAMESPEALAARMRAAGAPAVVINSAYKGRTGKLANVTMLQAVMAWWAQAQVELGRTEREIDKLFYLLFGTDRFSALAQDSAGCLSLADRIVNYLGGMRHG